MGGETLTLRKADATTVSYVASLLEEHGLPTDDVREQPDRFYVGYDGSDRVGVGGLEVYGASGLLRSLVVERGFRGNGFGTAICDELEARARANGVERVYLLTTTAAAFFEARGFTEIDRSDAPSAIERTTQFADLCPSTATCLVKPLTPPGDD